MLKLQFTIDAVDRATAKLTGINRAVEKSVERLSAPYRKLRASINGLVENSGMDKLQAATGRVRERFAGLPLLATLAAGGISAAMVQTIRRIDQLNDTAKTVKLPAEQVQRLGYAAQMSGTSLEEMSDAMVHLFKSMGKALSGDKEMQKMFEHLGISMKRLAKMDVSQVIEAIADKFHKVGDAGGNAAKKVDITAALMSRSGSKFIQFLDQGSSSIRELYAEADKAGLVSQEMAGRFASAADSLDRMTFGANGFLATVTGAALPGIERLVQSFTELGQKDRDAFGQKIGKSIGGFLERLPALLTSLASIAGAIAFVVGKVDTVAQAFGGWDTVIVVFASVMAGKGVWAVYELVKALGLLGGALAMTPVGLFLLAVGAVALAAYSVYKHWEPIKKFFSDLWDGIVAKFDWAKNKVSGWIPNWMKGAAQPYAVSTAAGRASAVPQAAGSPFKTELGGTLRIQVDADGKPRVTEMRKAAGSPIDFDVYSGPAMGMP
jgi:hypothetical protein